MKGECYAHEQVSVEPGRAGAYLEEAAERGQPLYGEHGWKLIGAWETAMVNETEAFLLWAVPSWEQWGALETAERTHGPFRTYRQSTFGQTRDFHRFLLVDSPLSPLRTGRQPQVSDRDPQLAGVAGQGLRDGPNSPFGRQPPACHRPNGKPAPQTTPVG